MNKINGIFEKILTLSSDDTAQASVIVGVRKDTGEVMGAGFTEQSAMDCALCQYNTATGAETYAQEQENEKNAEALISLVKVPLW